MAEKRERETALGASISLHFTPQLASLPQIYNVRTKKKRRLVPLFVLSLYIYYYYLSRLDATLCALESSTILIRTWATRVESLLFLFRHFRWHKTLHFCSPLSYISFPDVAQSAHSNEKKFTKAVSKVTLQLEWGPIFFVVFHTLLLIGSANTSLVVISKIGRGLSL